MAESTIPDPDARADELLAIRCQLGERAAFDDLIERWHGPLWRYVRRLVVNEEEAADTLQDAWLRVLRALPGLRDPARLRPWLFGIARRTVMDRLRRRYAEPAPASLEGRDLPGVEDPRPMEEDLDLMREELAGLPLVEREVLVLFHLRELTLAQVAEALAVPVGTVKSRLFRARRLLRERLTNRGMMP